MARLVHEGRRRYEERLRSLPPSGGGGCHPALLGCATLGIHAGVQPEQILEDLRRNVRGTREVPDREIEAAVARAVSDGTTWHADRRPRPARRAVFEPAESWERLVKAGRGVSDADVSEKSPVRIDWPPEEDSWRVLDALYGPQDFLYIGQSRGPARVGGEIQHAEAWIRRFRMQGATGPHVIPNPLTGKPAMKADGNGQTVRGDACIAEFRFAVVEFDDVPRDEQLAFWWSACLPVVLLVDSGGKSVHGWIRVKGVREGREWARIVEKHLFGNLLQPLGVDGACRNESRLSRLPGHRRLETGRWQRLLYLAPEGKAVAA